MIRAQGRRRRPANRPWAGILLLAVAAAGCAKPPVEEIASAEAALQAARQAEAPEYAPEPFAQAEELMLETYRLSDEKAYPDARTRAVETRDKANEAKDLALRRRGQNGGSGKGDTASGGDGDGGRIETKSADQTRAEIESESIGAGTMDEGDRLESLGPIYFDFDDYSIRDDQRTKVEDAAAWLEANPSARIRIEGHTDERGAADYNLALGSQRAKSVKELLVSLGVDPERIEVRSYGEEAPADLGHDDAAWSENRRAEFVVLQE